MTYTDNLGNVVQAGISGIVNIKTVQAVTKTANRGLGKATKSRKKGFDIW